MASSFQTSQHKEKCDHLLKAISRLLRLTQHWIIIPGILQIPEGIATLEQFHLYYLYPKQPNIQIYLLRNLKNKLPLQIFELRKSKWLRHTLELCLIPFIRLQD